jgi:membrane protein required for colicin V production
MITAFDIVVGLLVLISALLATMRGLTREVLSLATWGGSALFAWIMDVNYPELARQYVDQQIVADIATVLVSFIVALIVLHLLTMWIADLIVDSKIGPLDRSLGFIFGGLRGVLIAVALVIFGQFLFANTVQQWGGNSKSLPILNQLGDDLIAMLPDDLEGMVSGMLKGSEVPAVDPTQGGGTDELEEEISTDSST